VKFVDALFGQFILQMPHRDQSRDGRHPARQKRSYLGLAALSIAVFAAVHYLRSSIASPTTQPTHTIIEGRWKLVHAALGMPVLPDRVEITSLPPLQMDLRKRRQEQRSALPPPPPLHFVPEASDDQREGEQDRELDVEVLAKKLRADASFQKGREGAGRTKKGRWWKGWSFARVKDE
jgi:hypothetical protein